MLDERSRIIMEILISKPAIELEQLMAITKLAKNQIEYSIEKVNELHAGEHLPIITVNDRLVKLPLESRKFWVNLFLSESLFVSYEMSSKEREKYIFLLLIYRSDEYLSMDHFLDALQISKTTFMNDIKKVEASLANKQIKINYNRKQGYFIVGKEVEIRYQLMKMIINDFSKSPQAFFYNFFIENEAIQDKKQLEMTLKVLMNKYQINLVENRLNEFVYSLLLILPRIQNNWQYDTEFQNNMNHFSSLNHLKEYHFSKELLADFNIDSEIATYYLCAWILGISIGDSSNHSPDYVIIMGLVERIVQRFELLSGIRFKNQKPVIKQLYSHFRPAYYRLIFHFPIINLLHDKILKEYSDLFFIVKETLKPITDLMDFPIPNEEASFLTIHFASLIQEYEEYPVQRKVALIVCPNGVGNSSIIYNEIKNIFSEFIILGPIDTKSVPEFLQPYDMIFTTVPNIQLYTLKKPIFVVSPIMSTQERYALIQEVYSQYNSSYQQVFDVSKLFKIIEENTEVMNKEKLLNKIDIFFNNQSARKITFQNENWISEKQAMIKLRDILPPENIQLDVMVRGWKEAIYISAAPLLMSHAIERSYIDKIIQMVKNEGPFMIIMDKVALPHASPEDGANKIGLTITALRQSVWIGDKEIKYLFTLSAIDRKQHLGAIAELMKLIENPEFFNRLDTSRSSDEVLSFINKQLA
ncbi:MULTISPECIES: BglG family transcription antiterminator [unclassified Enterococcus]|uniref:BglG family transcription antiterminator n=1 Tax=unclassified Enterococcus TaxID=2608891 RepID=UPI00155307A4|nr:MULTISPECIES: BglG family transcription antiterminator [unclassified Enterococcus]MBS7576507.1 BglG family transcription antiterminator [Enterococcus sp. MMGLQ5-2]MBS7585600.1 BglG family transcription antiterminator [Enterococcus sp. MMGLQ5-1]NPD13459.1 BglG family transcription antiterminator [Enterococcus sp. MMGLQ5-1]NPD36344.1 BglG family transcription antiterminator [Enterococcus sp. MMGLQ5-2]